MEVFSTVLSTKGSDVVYRENVCLDKRFPVIGYNALGWAVVLNQ